MRCFLGLLALILLAPAAFAQREGVLDIADETHAFLQRQQTRGLLPLAFLDEQPISAYRAARYLDSLAVRVEAEPDLLPPDERARLDRLRGLRPGPNAEAVQRRIGLLYEDGENVFSVEEGPFRMHVNPGAYLSMGRAREDDVPGEIRRDWLYRNTRAVQIGGSFDRRFFFDARLEENQVVEPMRARERERTRLPLAFQADPSEFDYMLSRATIGYQDRYLELRLGTDRVRWGPARGSLYLSDFSPPHVYVQARVEVWRVAYTAHYAVLDDNAVPPDDFTTRQPVKYAGFHRLALDLPGRVQLGLFDAIVLAPQEEQLATHLTFMQPLIFFNALDRGVNSPGNVLLGADMRWTATPGASLYGQAILDDFEYGRLFSDAGYWKNTWGWLAGAHAVVPWVDGLEVTAEASRVRPYVYSNLSGSLSHTHNEGFLGSPSGPNSQTYSLRSVYRPTERLRAEANAVLLQRGRSHGGLNFGENPFVPYTDDRVSDEAVETLQGIRQDWTFLEGRLGYELLPNLFAEGVLRYEALRDAETGTTGYTGAFVQLRWGFPPQHPLY